MIKIKKYKTLNEEDSQQQVINNNQPQQLAPLQPLNNTAAQQNVQQQPANNTAAQQNVQALPLNNNTQNTLQNVQQQAPANPYEEKIKLLLDEKHLGNIYWAIAVNVPEEIQKEIPDFKTGNQAADPIIKLWETFKQNLNKESYDAWVNAFANFGTVQNNTLQNTQQQNALLNTQQINAGLQVAYDFSLKLSENLLTASKKKYYNKVINNYFNID